jgi:predicted CoA-binding protein
VSGGGLTVGASKADTAQYRLQQRNMRHKIPQVMDDALRQKLLPIFDATRTIAVVGASGDITKASFRIPKYLQSQGYQIRPVNPHGGLILGEPVARSLAEVEGPVDVVDVFRPADEAPQIARDAVAIGAKVLWLQAGIESEEARQVAEAAGLTVVMNRCMGTTHGELGLGPGPP